MRDGRVLEVETGKEKGVREKYSTLFGTDRRVSKLPF